MPSPPLIVATAWSSYDDTAFANKSFIRYQGRVINGQDAILLFRTGIDAIRTGQPRNRLLHVVRWIGMEPRPGELLLASREQQGTSVVINIERRVLFPRPMNLMLARPQFNVTILNITPAPAHRTIESAAQEQPAATSSNQHPQAPEAQAIPTNVTQQREPIVQVKQEAPSVTPPATAEDHEIVDLTWLSDTEEDVKPTVPALEQEQEASTSSGPSQSTRRTRTKLATCPSAAEIHAMAKYVMSKPARTDMREPDEWRKFDPRRGIFAWARIYSRREEEIKRLIKDAKRSDRFKARIAVKLEH